MNPLNDRDILEAFEGKPLDGVTYPRRPGERAMAYVARVRGEHRAWQASKEDQVRREAERRRASLEEQRESVSRSDSGGVETFIQGGEVQLGAIIQSQISEVCRRIDAAENEVERLRKQLASDRSNLEKLIKAGEIYGVSPKIHRQDSEDIPGEDGDGGESEGSEPGERESSQDDSASGN